MKSSPLMPSGYYHIYNRANGSDLLFRDRGNYYYFLKIWKKYMLPVSDTLCYCLMPNHFHFLVKIHNFENFDHIPLPEESIDIYNISKYISQQLSNCFNAYSRSFNLMYKRKGSLFSPNFKRKLIEDEKYMRTLVSYIHYNPVKHNFCKDPMEWRFSSYRYIKSGSETWCRQDLLLAYFDGWKDYKNWHKVYGDLGALIELQG